MGAQSKSQLGQSAIQESDASGNLLEIALYETSKTFDPSSSIKVLFPEEVVTYFGNMGQINFKDNDHANTFNRFNNKLVGLANVTLLGQSNIYAKFNQNLTNAFVISHAIPYVEHVKKQKDGDMVITPNIVNIGTWITLKSSMDKDLIKLQLSFTNKAINGASSKHVGDLQIGKPDIAESSLLYNFSIPNHQITFLQMPSAQKDKSLLLVVQPDLVKTV
ncbi:hypothetical protein [Cysteiniphilum sp. 6C5]|uniref:hypothetical protein n=1 Tax=unclassified Cysteiniphilum TaxID=2610889 RepID=UPI003F85410D